MREIKIMKSIWFVYNFQSAVCLPFLKGELCLFRLLLLRAQRRDEAAEDFFRAGLFFSASRCSFKSWSLFCFCKAMRCCCKDRLGIRPESIKRPIIQLRRNVFFLLLNSSTTFWQWPFSNYVTANNCTFTGIYFRKML